MQGSAEVVDLKKRKEYQNSDKDLNSSRQDLLADLYHILPY